jgi:4'-phosphopantetheinyl transferase
MPSAAPPEPSTAWSAPPPVLTLCAHEVHVWRAELDGGGETDVERLALTLAPDERARAASFVFPPDRRRFTLGRVALRSVLARYLDVEPGAVTLGRTPEGRPTLTGALAGALHFSVSRSAGLALCAVAIGRDIGVDVERIMRGVVEDVVADRVLSPAEVTALRALPPAARERAFFAVWTRKEAYAKARGLGLALPFEEFTVSTDPATPALLAADDDDPARWTLRDLDAGPGYAAALAIDGPIARVLAWQWAPDLSSR